MLGAIIKEKRQTLKLSLEDIGRHVGTSRQSVSNWENDESVPGTIFLIKLSQILDLPLKDMLYSVSGLETSEVILWDRDTSMGEDDVSVPLHTESFLSAGPGAIGNIENSGPKLHFSKSSLKREGIEAGLVICVKVQGESMEPKLSHGSTVGVDTGKTQIIDGDMYAVLINGEARIKRLVRTPGGVRLVSNNPDKDLYPDERYEWDGQHEVQVVGRIFWYSEMF